MRMESIEVFGTSFEIVASRLAIAFEAWQAKNPRQDFHSFHPHWFNRPDGTAGGRLTFFYDSPKENLDLGALLGTEHRPSNGVETPRVETGLCPPSSA
jgi:hypothetical protein